MLVATPGQTTYSTLLNNSSNGSSNNTAATTSSAKKSSTLNSTNVAASGTAKSLNNNNNNHTTSTVTSKNSLNSNTHTQTFNYRPNPNIEIVSKKHCNESKATATSSREINSSITVAATHSLKNENSTNITNTTNNRQKNFIQTLKDSVQKALISTTGGSNNNSVVNKHFNDNKLQTNCTKSTTSINNVTSTSSSASHNVNKISTTASSNTSSTSTAATQSLSSVSVVRSKYFSCSLLKLHTVAPTIIHRYPEERQHASSTDSLQKEMYHFKPIRIVPKTPWKSGSKSRGNSLRFPKANLATKKSEFLFKSNCDVNNRKKKQQQNRNRNNKTGVDEDDVDNDNEQENKYTHGIYKPKPSSTCLSSITTPNHQSAFVCLVAQMKNLVNRQLTPVNSAGAVVEAASVEELYTRKKQKPAKKQQKELEKQKELTKMRSTRLNLNALKNKRVSNTTTTQENAKQTNAKSNNISKVLTAAITKAKSRSNLGRGKSKTNNSVASSTTKAKKKLQNSVSMPAIANKKLATTTANKSTTRKRKSAQDDSDLHNQDVLNNLSAIPSSTSIKSLSLGPRKSARLSTKYISGTTNELFKCPTNITGKSTVKYSQKPRKNPTTAVCFSPPLTRSRLKRLAEQGKIVTTTTADNKKRKI